MWLSGTGLVCVFDEKATEITELMSIPDQRWTVHFTWSPGAAKLPTAPGRCLRKDSPGWEKAENEFTATSGLPARVCVCVLCRLHICTWVFQCVVRAIKNLTKVLIIIIILMVIPLVLQVVISLCFDTTQPTNDAT